jgi:non-specific protein-tyrosine kinase
VGEIADALRRSGGTGAGASLEPQPAGPRSGPTRPLPEPSRPGRTAGAGRTLPDLTPGDPAILHEEGPGLDACRQIALRVRSDLQRHGARTLAVVSALRDEGKTTTSCNLAIALASLDAERAVALVGLDLRRPTMAKALGVRVEAGVEQVLTGNRSLEDVRIAIERLPLDLYPARDPQRNAHEILTDRRLSDLVGALEQRYDTVIIDTPPVLVVPDARLILAKVPWCLPVARAGMTRVRSFREMLATLPPRRVLGTLLNGGRLRGHYYQGYDYTVEDEEDTSPKKRRGSGEGRG